MSTRTDWRKPIAAHAEETYWVEPAEDGTNGDPRRAIRWHLSEEGLERVKALMACALCLTTFPAPPRKDTWRIWKTSGFGFLFPLPESKRLVCEERCPICKSTVSAEQFKVQNDEEWSEEDEKLFQGNMLALEDDRERFDFMDMRWVERLGLRDPVAPPSRRKSMKRRGES